MELQPSSFTLTSLSFDCQYRVRVWPTISSVDTGLSPAGADEQSSFGPARSRPLRPTRFRGSRSVSDAQTAASSAAGADAEHRLALDPAAALSSLQSSSSSGPSPSQSGRYAGRARYASAGAAGAVGGSGGRGGRVREAYTRQIRTNGVGVSFYLNFSEIRFVTPSCDRMRSLPPAIFCPKRVHLDKLLCPEYFVQHLYE